MKYLWLVGIFAAMIALGCDAGGNSEEGSFAGGRGAPSEFLGENNPAPGLGDSMTTGNPTGARNPVSGDVTTAGGQSAAVFPSNTPPTDQYPAWREKRWEWRSGDPVSQEGTRVETDNEFGKRKD